MGGGLSVEEEERFASELFQMAQSKNMLPDIGIDSSILKYSGLDSAAALGDYSVWLINDLATKGPDLMKDMGSTLTTFKNIPNAVGLGALIISFLLDVTVSGLMKTHSDGGLGVLQRVFAEEKASGVRDSVDEYIKRFRLHMHKPEALLDDTKRMEAQVSDGLTRLRNSMLKDNQVSTRSMKHWTSGAAFHLQMLIHVARMEMAKRSFSESELNVHVMSVSSMIEYYENDLKSLLAKYETYKRSTIYTGHTNMRCTTLYGTVCMYIDCGIYDTEFGKHAGLDKGDSDKHCTDMTNAYLNYMFNNWNQIKELREYFTGLKQNLKEAIMQKTTFNIQQFLPDSRT